MNNQYVKGRMDHTCPPDPGAHERFTILKEVCKLAEIFTQLCESTVFQTKIHRDIFQLKMSSVSDHT